MTLFHALGPFASAGVLAAPGMVLVSPTSITHSGTSATLGANGQVTFTAVTSLSLNGVFTAGFDNYLVIINYTDTGSNVNALRFRASGVDATGSDYTRQWIGANGTSISGFRGTTSDGIGVGYTNSTAIGQQLHIYGPFLAQPTASRGVNVNGNNGARFLDIASTHSLSASYDGFTLFAITSMTGALAVYGIRS